MRAMPQKSFSLAPSTGKTMRVGKKANASCQILILCKHTLHRQTHFWLGRHVAGKAVTVLECTLSSRTLLVGNCYTRILHVQLFHRVLYTFGDQK